MSAPRIQNGGTLRTVGPSSSLSVTSLNNTSLLAAELTSTTHGAIGVSGSALLSGDFLADFNGATASLGSTWDIIDASSFTGSFHSVSVAGASLSPGQVASLNQVVGGDNGNLLQLGIEQVLVLNMSRTTKIASIKNLSGSPVSFTIDGYLVESALGSMDPDGWNSLEDQGGGTWFESGTVTANSLSETSPESSTTLAAGQSVAIGPIYKPRFVQLGQETEDHVFTFTTTAGDIRQGSVIYEGDKQLNNMVLTVDPTSGGATIQNESGLSVVFDGYTITSVSNSLTPDTWNSLEAQGAVGGDWLEANPTNARVSEVMSECCTTLGTFGGFDIGTLWNTGGSRDLAFEFLIEGQSDPFEGVVVYGALPTVSSPLLADVDHDGDVDGSDFLIIQRTDPSLIPQWASEFGGGAPPLVSAVQAVPEPGTSFLLLLALSWVGVLRMRRR